MLLVFSRGFKDIITKIAKLKEFLGIENKFQNSGVFNEIKDTWEPCSDDSAVLVPSHQRRGATAVLVWHDRRGSAVVPSLIAVAPRKTVKTAVLRGGTAETLNKFKTSAVPRGLSQSAVGSPRHRHDRRGTVQEPQ